MLFFATTDDTIYEPGTPVELCGLGPALPEDCDPDDPEPGRPFIHARSAHDEMEGGWYFRSDMLRPLTTEAIEAYAELLQAELEWAVERAVSGRLTPVERAMVEAAIR